MAVPLLGTGSENGDEREGGIGSGETERERETGNGEREVASC